MINVGDKAPEVLGINEKGEEIRLSAYKGKKIVLIADDFVARQTDLLNCCVSYNPFVNSYEDFQDVYKRQKKYYL